jgi:predicted dehydrogenase
MGITEEEISQVLELVKQTRLTYMMAETCYYFPCAIWCRKAHEEGKFGAFQYGAAQYYHDIGDMQAAYITEGDRWKWMAGIPPMYYSTHSMSMLFSAIDDVPEEVTCFGVEDTVGDGIYGKGNNAWDNPFSNETAILRMKKGGLARINEFRRVGINKPSSYITCFYGDKGAYECSVTNHTFQRGVASGETPYMEDVGPLVNTIRYNEEIDTMDKRTGPISVRYIEGYAAIQDTSRLPVDFRNEKPYSHYNSHPFLVDDFVRAVMTGKLPPNNAWDAARYMIPGLIAHESALQGGVLMDIPDFGDAPADWEKLTFETPDYYEVSKNG